MNHTNPANTNNNSFFNIIQTLASFSEEEKETIDKVLKRIHIPKDKIIIQQGQVCQHLYFVEKGCLRTFYTSENASEFTRCIAFENSFCWSVESFIRQQPSKESIEALTDSVLLTISHKEFYILNKTIPSFQQAYLRYVEQLCISYADRVESLLCLNATDRYEQLLEKNPSVVAQLKNGIVASYLGITQESLSRIKKNRI